MSDPMQNICFIHLFNDISTQKSKIISINRGLTSLVKKAKATDMVVRATFKRQSGPHFNINNPSYQYRDPHVKDKLVLQASHL